MVDEPVLHLIDRVESFDKQYRIFLATREKFAPQVWIKTYRVVDEDPGLSLLSLTRFRLRPAVRIANAILEANDHHARIGNAQVLA